VGTVPERLDLTVENLLAVDFKAIRHTRVYALDILNCVGIGFDMGEKRSNHTVYNVNYHFVWCPKYRHTILDSIEDSLEAIFRDVCDEYGYEILSLHISPDHVHLFLSAHP
jgi:hypothetical protein